VGSTLSNLDAYYISFFIFSFNQRYLPGIRSPYLEFSSKLFAFTADGHLMLSCGYWDNSIRLMNTDRGKDKLKACVSFHNGKLRCVNNKTLSSLY